MGWTPLHFAAQKGQLEACKLIMGNVTEKNPANMCGQTPKSLAIENDHEDIGELIDDATGFNGHPFELHAFPFYKKRSYKKRPIKFFNHRNSNPLNFSK